MIEAVGAALLFVACTGIGFRVAREYRERPRQLRALLHAVRVLQTEIEFTATPLPMALERVAMRSQPPVDTLFHTAAEELTTQEVSVAGAFTSGVERCLAASSLKRQECDVLKEFGTTLGQSDLAHQRQHIEVALASLTALEREAREAQRKNERLWQYLGVLTGLLMVVLFY